jgi:hypothetical protein
MSCTWTTISIYYNKLQKHCFKIHAYYEKKLFEKKNIQSFPKVIMLVHCISFAPTCLTHPIGHKHGRKHEMDFECWHVCYYMGELIQRMVI